MRHAIIVGSAFALISVSSLLAPIAASAAEPLLLVLEGEKVSELKYSAKAGAVALETAGGKTITCTSAEDVATFKPDGEKAAAAEAGSSTAVFFGCKKEKIACRSETAKGEKDAVETVLAPLSLTVINEKPSEGGLSSAAALKLQETLIANCGTVKTKAQGSGFCPISPSSTKVTAGSAVTLNCESYPGACVERTATCEQLSKEPFEANVGGSFEATSVVMSLSGSFNKMIFLDD